MKIAKRLIIIALTLAAILTAGGFLAAQFGFFSGGTNAPSVPEDTMTRGLVGYWSFDEGSGSTAYDASGNGNDGTLIHDPKWTQGKSGSALQFDGVDDYVDCGNDESLNITDAITVEAWVKWSAGVNKAIMDKRDEHYANGGKGWMLRGDSNGIDFAFGNGSDNYWRNNIGTISINEFYHIAVTLYISGTIGTTKIYINGKEVDSCNHTIVADLDISNNHSLIIGSYWNTNQSIFNGSIDEVRIYNRALSAEEVRYHYNHGGPVASWNFDEGSGTVVHDSSGNGFDGVLHEYFLISIICHCERSGAIAERSVAIP